MLDRIRRAVDTDIDAVTCFYRQVCDAQETDEYGPVWHFGIYPDPEGLKSRIQRGELWIGLAGDCIAAAMVVTAGEDPLYLHLPWKFNGAADEICALHLFAVHPAFRRSGVSREMLEALLDLVRKAGCRCIHLDVVKGNLPAEKLYCGFGFRYIGEQWIFYEDTGDLLVNLYEFIL